MQLETLLKQLTWLRRGWLVAAAITGVLYGLLIPFYLYTAWVQYVVVATGVATHTGVNGWLVRLMARWAGLMDASIIVFQVIGMVLWFGWLWFSSRFAVQLGNPVKLRFNVVLIAVFWFVPVLNLIIVPLVLMDLARATLHDPQLEDAFEGQAEITWLAWAIAVLNLTGDGLFLALAHRSADAFNNAVSGQTLMHLAAASGVVALLLLLTIDAYIRRMTRAQDIRLARIHLH